MILFLRNKKNESIVDIDLYINENDSVELHASVIIEPYSKFLLENLDKAEEIIEDFSEIDGLRGWMWEVYFSVKENVSGEYNNVLKLVRSRILEIANKYNLSYVED